MTPILKRIAYTAVILLCLFWLFIKFGFDTVAHDVALHSFPEYTDYCTSIASAVSYSLLEGLPDPGNQENFEREITKPDIISLKGEYESDALHFYSTPLPLSHDEKVRILETVTDISNVSRVVYAKLCGSFHADYALKCESPHLPTVQVNLCFGCSEILFTGGPAPLKCELTPNAYSDLKALLLGKRLSRPNEQKPSFFEQASHHAAQP